MSTIEEQTDELMIQANNLAETICRLFSGLNEIEEEILEKQGRGE